MTVHCLNGCNRSWPRDPILEVGCPACNVGPGVQCRRPSGHYGWKGQGQFHKERDIAADRAGAYGPCPLQRCGLVNVERRKALETRQLALI